MIMIVLNFGTILHHAAWYVNRIIPSPTLPVRVVGDRLLAADETFEELLREPLPTL
jgi:hypothetical protein